MPLEKTLTEEELAEMKEMYCNGSPWRALQSRFKVGREGIERKMRRAGIPKRTYTPPSGPKASNYVDGSTSQRKANRSERFRSKKVRLLREEVFRRDHGKCRKCGSQGLKKGDICMHHLRRWAGSDDALRYDPKNIILLCQKCHYWVHSKKNIHGEYLVGPHRFHQEGAQNPQGSTFYRKDDS